MEFFVQRDEKKSMWKEVFEWVQAIVVALVVAMFLRTYVFTLVDVSGSSMVPTLHDKDKLFVWRMANSYKPGDIIIFRPAASQNTPYVKRVIATEGQSVDIRYNALEDIAEVYVDDKKLDEPYINEMINGSHIGDGSYPCVVPENCLFVLGDNRNNSSDSRLSIVGMVDVESVIGEAKCRLWPFDSIGGLK